VVSTVWTMSFHLLFEQSELQRRGISGDFVLDGQVSTPFGSYTLPMHCAGISVSAWDSSLGADT